LEEASSELAAYGLPRGVGVAPKKEAPGLPLALSRGQAKTEKMLAENPALAQATVVEEEGEAVAAVVARWSGCRSERLGLLLLADSEMRLHLGAHPAELEGPSTAAAASG